MIDCFFAVVIKNGSHSGQLARRDGRPSHFLCVSSLRGGKPGLVCPVVEREPRTVHGKGRQ